MSAQSLRTREQWNSKRVPQSGGATAAGEAYVRLHQWEKGAADFAKANSLKKRDGVPKAPTSFHAQHNLGVLFYHRGNYEKARELFDKAVMLDDQSIHNQIWMAIRKFRTGDKTAAQVWLQRVQATQSEHSATWSAWTSELLIPMLIEEAKSLQQKQTGNLRHGARADVEMTDARLDFTQHECRGNYGSRNRFTRLLKLTVDEPLERAGDLRRDQPVPSLRRPVSSENVGARYVARYNTRQKPGGFQTLNKDCCASRDWK